MGSPLPHLRRDWAHSCHFGPATGLACPHLRRDRDWAQPGLRHTPRVPHVPQVWVADWRHVYIGSANMDWRSLSQVSHICAGTGLTPAHICAGTALAS